MFYCLFLFFITIQANDQVKSGLIHVFNNSSEYGFILEYNDKRYTAEPKTEEYQLIGVQFKMHFPYGKTTQYIEKGKVRFRPEIWNYFSITPFSDETTNKFSTSNYTVILAGSLVWDKILKNNTIQLDVMYENGSSILPIVTCNKIYSNFTIELRQHSE